VSDHHPSRRRTRNVSRAAVLAALAILAPLTLAQDRQGPGDRQADGLSREQMWRAPTADEWKRPVLITFQRTWEDAVAVSKETGKPILVCVNMDGEIASEHYAGIRYRQPEIAKLYEPYVCVIASTYRHNPRDYDDEGRRILCPRFGSVTCGEHIAIEPFLFEKFFDGERVAPRHIMVELDGEEQYDVYYAFDTASVFDAIQKGITDRKISPRPVVRGDRSIIERVASRDIRDREAVEAAYREGDETQRAALLEAAKKQGGDAPLDLLRLAVFGLDPNLAKSARGALAQSSSAAATDLIDEALRVPIDDTEREALVAALERLGEKSPRAQWLSVVHRGLSGKSASVDAEAWAKSRKAARRSWIGRDMDDLESEHASKAGVYRASPGDAAACVGHAEASLALAIKARKTVERDPRLSRMLARHLLEDAPSRGAPGRGARSARLEDERDPGARRLLPRRSGDGAPAGRGRRGGSAGGRGHLELDGRAVPLRRGALDRDQEGDGRGASRAAEVHRRRELRLRRAAQAPPRHGRSGRVAHRLPRVARRPAAGRSDPDGRGHPLPRLRRPAPEAPQARPHDARSRGAGAGLRPPHREGGRLGTPRVVRRLRGRRGRGVPSPGRAGGEGPRLLRSRHRPLRERGEAGAGPRGRRRAPDRAGAGRPRAGLLRDRRPAPRAGRHAALAGAAVGFRGDRGRPRDHAGRDGEGSPRPPRGRPRIQFTPDLMPSDITAPR
jgi:hypothetical protein